jgi:cytoskeletal protein CcmA (bactofilin family)
VGDLDTTGTLTAAAGSTTVLASIATTSVGTDLHVGGNSYLTGTINASGDLGVSGNASVNGQATTTVLVSIATTSVGTDLHVGGNSYLTGTLSAGATTITGTASITGTLSAGVTTITGTVTSSGYVLGRAVMAYVPATNGGFVGSLSNGSNVGFWNESGILTWSNADGAGVPIANTTRMTLNASNNLIVYGDVYALGAMHANGSGVYYPGLPNGAAHGIGFVWTTGGQLDVYIDKTRYGAVAVNFTDRDDEIAELRAMVSALEARVAALE